MGYSEDIIESKLQWANCLERQGAFPIDRTDLHASYEDAVKYARGDKTDSRKLGKLAYIGQIITVWGKNEYNQDGVWVYTLVPHDYTDDEIMRNEKILADLKPIGSGAGGTISWSILDD